MSLGPELNREVIRLKQIAVAHFHKDDWLELGMLIDQEELVQSHRLLNALYFGDDDYEGCALSVIKQMVEEQPAYLDTIAQFIQARAPDAGENVSSHDVSERRIVFEPSVFKVPQASVDKNLVAVMMPINAGTNATYQAIKAAAKSAEMECQRADDIWQESVLIQDIFNLIFRSSIVVCDFSGRNPNVFYEAGVAHTLGKHVVPITQSHDDIPFDLRHHRYLNYLNNQEGRAYLTVELAKRLRVLTGKPLAKELDADTILRIAIKEHARAQAKTRDISGPL